MRFLIVVISPPDYPHSAAFREIADLMRYGLQELGHTIRFSSNPWGDPNEIPIVFGANLLTKDAGLPDSCVLFNLEQVDDHSCWMRPEYLTLLRTHRVWDYSIVNIQRLRQRGVGRIQHVPIGHSPAMERIKAVEPDIDVLFYGSMNPRRQKVIQEMQQAGLQVFSVFGVYGEERDRLVARSKVVLNLHFYESKIFELVRVSDLLSNGRCVLSESGNDPVEQEFTGVVCFAPYAELVERCVELVRDAHRREQMGHAALQFMRARPQSAFLASVLPMLLVSAAGTGTGNPAVGSTRSGPGPAPAPAPVPLPRTCPDQLNVGSGKDFKPDWLNLDIAPEWNPDLCHDLNLPVPPQGLVVETRRFGVVRLQDETLSRILCQDVLEHLPQLTTAMTTFLRWLRVGGVLQVQVPYDLSHGAWQDPTHVRAFNERSWLYYTDWFWYLGWDRWRFHLRSIHYLLSALGQSLIQQGEEQTTVLRTPRAVDAMQVELVKQALTVQEQELYAQRHPRR